MDNSLNNKNILLTGAMGYIGQSLLRRLRDFTCHVTAVDLRVPKETVDSGKARVRFLEGDICAAEKWPEWLKGQQVVFHLAAQTSHYIANENPEKDWQLSVAPLLHMLSASQKLGHKPRIIFTSSATVYGLPDKLPVSENYPAVPLTIYDIHKVVCEYYLQFYARSGSVISSALRLANVYGPSSGQSSADRGVINQLIKRAFAGEPLTVFGSGAWLRDYVHLRDVIEAMILVASADEKLVNGKIFNVATGVGTKFVDVLKTIQNLVTDKFGKKIAIVHDYSRKLLPIDERNFTGDNGALRELSWRPQVTLAAGLAEMVAACR